MPLWVVPSLKLLSEKSNKLHDSSSQRRMVYKNNSAPTRRLYASVIGFSWDFPAFYQGTVAGIIRLGTVPGGSCESPTLPITRLAIVTTRRTRKSVVGCDHLKCTQKGYHCQPLG